MIALLACLAFPLWAQAPPILEPIPCRDCPWDLKLPDLLARDIGFWPVEQLYFVSLDWFGRERTDDWVKKGLESLQKNVYRKYYISGGAFLIQLPDPANPRRELDHMFYVPEDPSSEPLVIFMKDIHRLEQSGRGMSQSIARAIMEGDKDLVRLAGRTLFDAKFTVKEWSHTLHETNFGGTQAKGGGRPYYYKFRQNGLTRIRAEGGLGGAVQLGHAPYYVGGALGVESSSKYRSSGLRSVAVASAKVGLWGKVPFVPQTSFGLNAIQGWHAQGGVFETELRAGLFHGMGDATLGLVGYRRISGSELLSSQNTTVGAQAFYSPSSAVSVFLSYERNSGSAREDEEQVFLGGVSFLGRSLNTVDPGAWAGSLLGERETPEGRKAFYALALDGLAALAKPPARTEELLDALRASELSRLNDFVLRLPGGLFIVLTPGELLEAARSMEKRAFLDAPAGSDAPLPGWAPHDVRPRKSEDVAREILGRVPAADLRAALDFAEPTLAARVEKILLIHAASLRRSVDFRVTQALMFLSLTAEKANADPFARLAGDEPEAAALWRGFRSMRPHLAKSSREHLRRSAAWLRREFDEEGRKLQAELTAYGRSWLKAARESPAWPKGLTISVRPEDWPPLLAGYGESFLVELLDPFRERAAKPGAEWLNVELSYWPTPYGSFRVKKRSPSSFHVELSVPNPRKSRDEILDHARKTIRSAF